MIPENITPADWYAKMTTKIPEPIIGPKYKTPEWYALRKFNPDRKDRPIVFGASDCATICDQSPYSTAFEFYLQARDQAVDERMSETMETRIRLGLRFEDPILDEYEFREGVTLERDLPMLLSAEHSFMGASLDARYREDPEDFREVDAKNSGFRMFDRDGTDVNKYGKAGTDQVPKYILFQAQHQMAVTGTGRVDFAVVVDGSDFRIYTVLRNDDLIEQIIAAESEMAERIIAGDPPEPNWTHKGTNRLLKSLYGVTEKKTILLDFDRCDDLKRMQKLNLEIKDKQAEAQAIQNRLLHAMGDSQEATFVDSNLKLTRSITKSGTHKLKVGKAVIR